MLELVVVTIQGLATAGAFTAAMAALRAARRAETSAHASREAMMLPAKQEHTRQIKELLAYLARERPLGRPGGSPDLAPTAPSRQWVVEGAVTSPVSSFARGGQGEFQSQALFDDLETHLPGFKGQWVEMVSRMNQYLSGWSDVTYRLSHSLTEYFSYPFLNGSGNGLVRNVLTAAWCHLYGGPEPEKETFEDLQIGPSVHGSFVLFRRQASGPPQRYAFLPSETELYGVWRKLRQFRQDFPQYSEFKQQIGQLRQRYELMEEARESIRRLIRNAGAVVVFPEECYLLGHRPPDTGPVDGKRVYAKSPDQTHRVRPGPAISPAMLRMPEGGAAAVRRLRGRVAPAGAALLRRLRRAGR